ncbi:hypothetical protein [Rivibacter subsaxonicus]|uniref:Uncharacterized protein n=1 Tax=Rivibacter subsaxonicus TaxID=457575 RepID=A0A4V2FU47_9BURK|nr:hypothetical protein [Rivibacter subsaxonicus]RZU00616.1 hypothetical protein EV670_1327 [Rivibacter subsaxonicus]
MNLVALITGAAVAAATAAAIEQLAAAALRALWLSARPLSGEHSDSRLYHRQLFSPGESQLWPAWVLLVCAGLAIAAAWTGLGGAGWLWAAAGLCWLLALAWDLWVWERVAASVKFVSWRRGWRRGQRRLAVSDLREVHVIEKPVGPEWLPWRPQLVYLALVQRDGKAIKLPRTGSLFGAAGRVEELANFVRMQMDQVNETRKRIAAEKRRGARDAMLQGLPPVHPSNRPQTGL